MKISCQRAIFCLLKFLFNLLFQGKNEQRIPMLKLFSEDAMSVMLSAAQYGEFVSNLEIYNDIVSLLLKLS